MTDEHIFLLCDCDTVYFINLFEGHKLNISFSVQHVNLLIGI